MANPVPRIVAVPLLNGFPTAQAFVPSPGRALSGPFATSSFPSVPAGLAMITGSGYTAPRTDRARYAAPPSAMSQPGPGPFW